MDAQRYLRPFEHHVTRVRVSAFDGTYLGRGGVIRWSPDDGFSLMCGVREHKRASVTEFGGPRVILRTEWMKIEGSTDSGDTFNVNVPMVDELSLHMGRLRVSFPAATFTRKLGPTRTPRDGSNKTWNAWGFVDFGEAGHQPPMPDLVTRSMTLANHTMPGRVGRSGLRDERGGGYVAMAYTAEDDARFMVLATQLPRRDFKREETWNWIGRAGAGFGWLSGCAAQTVYVEQESAGTLRMRWRKRERIHDLFPYLPRMHNRKIEKSALLPLLDLLSRECNESKLAHALYDHVLESVRQHGVIGRDLLMASALEALLRNIYSLPFVGQKSRDAFTIDGELARFFRDHLPDAKAYRAVRKEAGRAFLRLRDRAAHPDWSLLAATPKPRADQALHDRIYLAHLYAHVVLRFAGVDVREPQFPTRTQAPLQ